MSTQSHLAPELLEQIFYLLPPTTQRVCLLVCKNWYTTVKPIYFSRISLLPYTNLSKVITGLQTTGDFVQSLTIEKNIQVTQEGLIRLITSCPSLLQLHAVSLYFKWVWLDGLELKRLNSVSIVGERFWTTPESYRYFYRVAYQHRGSIEDLHIPCTGDQELQDGFDGIIKYLSCFEKLKHLTLIDKYGHGPVVYFDTLLNTCKTLETLVIKLGHPLYSPTTVSNEQTITPFPSMRRLDIFLEGFSAEYLQYIIDRFVNITELDVFIRQSNMHWNRDKQEFFYFIHHKYIPFAKKALSVSSLTIYIEESTETGDLAAELFTTFRDIKKVCFEIDQGGLSATKIKLKTKQESTCTDLTLNNRKFTTS
ncbi:hypothetical protein EDC94DRAFT_699032 [Helicostylum pulchrum]|nr:hypothetical protein EDC94DRAFT_699032 [Helicostylum pulchrum]